MDAAADSGDGVGDELLPELAAAAVEGRAALGERAGQRDGRVGRDGRWEPVVKGPLCAEIEGFSLHAGAWVSARDREKLETLCRYAARPAVAESRLVELADGRIGYALKKRWRDGTTAVVMTKDVLMERLCALVPKPRKHLVTYHGVLAPASGLRPQVVPRQLEEEGEAGGCRHGAGGGGYGAASVEGVMAAGGDGVENVAIAALLRLQAERRVRARLPTPHGGGRRRGGRRRYSWAELLLRTFGIEVLVCPKCCGVRRVLAAIH
ncbi:MAG: transposase, partial [Phycisphaerae bacterium]